MCLWKDMFLLKRFSFLSIHRIYFIEILRGIYMKKVLQEDAGLLARLWTLRRINTKKELNQHSSHNQHVTHALITPFIFFSFYLVVKSLMIVTNPVVKFQNLIVKTLHCLIKYSWIHWHIMSGINLLRIELNVRCEKCFLKRCKWSENRFCWFSKDLSLIFFLLGFTPCKAEQPLQGME